MRMLASVGVFAEEPGAKFALTPLGETLKTDAPGSMRAMAMMLKAIGLNSTGRLNGWMTRVGLWFLRRRASKLTEQGA